MKLTCILATRGRPQLLTIVVAHNLQQMTSPDSCLLVCLDADDQASIEAVSPFKSERLLLSVREREDSLGAKYNRALEEAPADAYLHLVDYAPVVTKGFDEKIIEAVVLFPDNIGVVFSNLPLDTGNIIFPAGQVITAGLAKHMGYIFPPLFPYWFIDHWTHDIGHMIGRVAYADVEIDCTRRQKTQEVREPAFWADFFDALSGERERQAGAILHKMDATSVPELWKYTDRARSSWPFIHRRSWKINNMVRGQAQAMETAVGAGPPDERYLRIKAQAIAKLREVIAQAAA